MKLSQSKISRSGYFCGCDVRFTEEGYFFGLQVRMVHFLQIEKLLQDRQQSKRPYLEFLRVPALSAGIYVLPCGGADPQKPHGEDELYYVVSGRARMQVGTEHSAATPGSLVFVQARQEHRFYDIEEDLVVLVFFAPAEESGA
ncbi:MAG: cupin domain-containing protein [Candidatus Angelobacter sp.]